MPKQLFGRATRRLINELGNHALRPSKRIVTRESIMVALERVGERLNLAAPRLVDANSGDVFCLYTNASNVEPEKEVSVVSFWISVAPWFGGRAGEKFCDSVMAENQEQAIGELQAFTVLVSLCIWGLFDPNMWSHSWTERAFSF